MALKYDLLAIYGQHLRTKILPYKKNIFIGQITHVLDPHACLSKSLIFFLYK